MQRKHAPIPPIAVLLIGILAISFSAIFIKWSSAPASVIGMYRLLFTVLLMLPFLWPHRSTIRLLSGRDWGLLLLSGLFLGLHFLLWIGSLFYTSVASSTILLTLQPVFVMAGAYLLFQERIGLKALLSMAIAIVGTILIGWGDIGLSKTALVGDILSVLGTLAVSGYMLVGQNLRPRMSSLVYSVLVFLFAAAMLGVYNMAAGIPMVGYASREWGIFLLLAIVPTVFGHFMFNWLLKYVNATTISMSILGEPAGAVLLAYWLLGEKLTGFQVVGGMLAVAGVWMFLHASHVSHNETRVQ